MSSCVTKLILSNLQVVFLKFKLSGLFPTFSKKVGFLQEVMESCFWSPWGLFFPIFHSWNGNLGVRGLAMGGFEGFVFIMCISGYTESTCWWVKSARSKLVSFGIFSPFLSKSTRSGGQVYLAQIDSISGKSTRIFLESTWPRLDCTTHALLF